MLRITQLGCPRNPDRAHDENDLREHKIEKTEFFLEDGAAFLDLALAVGEFVTWLIWFGCQDSVPGSSLKVSRSGREACPRPTFARTTLVAVRVGPDHSNLSYCKVTRGQATLPVPETFHLE